MTVADSSLLGPVQKSWFPLKRVFSFQEDLVRICKSRSTVSGGRAKLLPAHYQKHVFFQVAKVRKDL